MKLRNILIVLILSALPAACGGGGSAPDTAQPPNEIETCDDGNEVPLGGCQTCPVVGSIPKTDTCPAIETCDDGSEVPLGGCQTCPVVGSIPKTDTCPAIETCDDDSEVLLGGCQTCPVVGSIPKTDTCPEIEDCKDGTMDLVGECDDDTEMPQPPFDTPEYNGSLVLSRINALYAYQNEYFGQNITVAVVGTGVLATHPDLDANIITNSLNYGEGAARLTDSDGNGHETGVAGVIAAKHNGTGIHGVAPLAKIVPVLFDFSVRGTEENDAQEADIFRGIARDGIPIANHSYNFVREYTGTYEGVRYTARGPTHTQVHTMQTDTAQANTLAEILKDSDTVHVWSAGNGDYNGETKRVALTRCANQASDSECIGSGSGGMIVSIGFFLDGFIDENYGILSTLNIPVITSGRVPNFPSLNNSLAEKWLVVVSGIERARGRYILASPSNGCGTVAKMWCITAFNRGVYTTTADGGYDRFGVGETSFSAPQAAGALAVLKSGAPEMPMTAIRMILLSTATPIGTRVTTNTPDELFGWGVINISAAVAHLETMETAETSGVAAVKLRDLRSGLPAAFSHLRGRLGAISVAVKTIDGVYHNIALSDFIPAAETPAPSGNAAKEILQPVISNPGGASSFAFSVFGDSQNGGVRFFGGNKTLKLSAEISRFAENNIFGGANFGALGAADTTANGGKIRMLRALGENLNIFGEYETQNIRAAIAERKFIAGIRGAKADGWTAGLESANFLRNGGKIRISAKQKTAFSGGEIILQYPQAAGDAYQAFAGKTPQRIAEKQTAVSLKRRPSLIWTIGYAAAIGNREWAAAAEYDNNNGKSALSAQWKINF